MGLQGAGDLKEADPAEARTEVGTETGLTQREKQEVRDSVSANRGEAMSRPCLD